MTPEGRSMVQRPRVSHNFISAIADDMRHRSIKAASTSGGAPGYAQQALCEQCSRRSGSIYEERYWHRPIDDSGDQLIKVDILISRWTDLENRFRREVAASPYDRHIIRIALRDSRLKLIRGQRLIFDGAMPEGTLHITSPAQCMTAEFRDPFDFVHLYVLDDYFRALQGTPLRGKRTLVPDLGDVVVSDPLARLLGRELISCYANDPRYAESIGRSLVTHIATLERPGPADGALLPARLERVQEYVDAHLDDPPTLATLAGVAGLSQSHFAAQFRRATGNGLHDYLLHRRIERAKVILSSTDMPLVELALFVGFQGQAHFSAVFKARVGDTPARWRRNAANMRYEPSKVSHARSRSRAPGPLE
ncbi:AraC family transcriptional regulator [Bradyrhizobium sp. JR7.2]|uniref:AraC family transcriptional regulator n=1 Tax=unclassified Bradyrhizobium TaxID=2631580 RepID=UPI0033995169